MGGFKRFLCCVLVTLLSVDSASAGERNQHTTIVLFGATGDLALKYLWQSIFNVYTEKTFVSLQKDGLDLDTQQSNHSFSFVGVGRSAQEKGIALLDSKLTENINCDAALSEFLSSSDCAEVKKKFISSVDYVKFTDNSEGHTQFCDQFQKMVSPIDGDKKVKVIMYMAIPTTAYVSFLENFNQICSKQVIALGIDIKWGLEKPFGMDKISANNFADKLQTSYDGHEIYHIDHYLQKSVVKTILQFRYLNGHLENVWNKENIERVEIFLKETIDVKDRVSFYNPMGVLRDIHQNHLTELLILTAMELPVNITSSKEISQGKSDLIRLVESVKDHNIVFGQYSDYAKHVSLKMTNDTKTSDVPTFAAAVLKINSARWKGVPFILLSGKQLDRQESYVRVVFKDRHVCVSGCGNNGGAGNLMESRPQVVFHIGHGDLASPAILVSKSFGYPVWPDNVVESDPANSDGLYKGNDNVYQTAVSGFFAGVVDENLPAYHSIFRDLTDGISSHFVFTHQLLLSWHIWDSIVTSGLKNVRIYDQSDVQKVLDFRFDDENRLTFVHDSTIEMHKYIGKEKYKLHLGDVDEDEDADENVQLIESPAKFLGWKLVTSESSLLASLLGNAISEMAKEEIKVKGSFHMALSGGSSIVPVLQSLASSFASLPWDSIHIWQVDERCVPHHDDQSNFDTLDRELFRRVNIPFSNIHAMPVDIAGDLCDNSLGGAHLYTEAIKTHVVNSRLDLAVLGLGADGHTASLFPESPSLHVDSDTFVTISNDGPDGTRRRMTLTLPLINRSKHVAVLAMGSRKRDILQRLEGSRSLDQYPILGVRPSNGTLTWYIDDLALSTQSSPII